MTEEFCTCLSISRDPLCVYHGDKAKRMTVAITDYDISQAMQRFGGSFVKGLGALWQAGDEINRRRLKVAFPDFWREYQLLAERWEAEHPKAAR